VHLTADADGHAAAPEVKMSDVLLAMGVPEEFGFGTLRLSLGRHSTEQDVDTAAAHIIAAIQAAWNKQ
jgi:cysteine sulfinate desulfinase/cysteine desulfurase-like protein